MTLKECENRNQAVLRNAISWAKGEDCLPLTQLDVCIVTEYLDLNLPQCFYHFVESDNVNDVRATGAHKTIFKVLDKIKDKLLLKYV